MPYKPTSLQSRLNLPISRSTWDRVRTLTLCDSVPYRPSKSTYFQLNLRQSIGFRLFATHFLKEPSKSTYLQVNLRQSIGVWLFETDFLTEPSKSTYLQISPRQSIRLWLFAIDRILSVILDRLLWDALTRAETHINVWRAIGYWDDSTWKHYVLRLLAYV